MNYTNQLQTETKLFVFEIDFKNTLLKDFLIDWI